MKKEDRVELAAIREQLIEATNSITEILERYANGNAKQRPAGKSAGVVEASAALQQGKISS